MSSPNASALFSRTNTFHWLLVLFLFLTPQLVLAQTSEPPPQGDEDPILFSPEEVGTPGGFTSFLCRESNAGSFCAAEMRFGGRFPVDTETGPDTFTFVLATHETVRLETRGEIDTYGMLYAADGRRLAADADGGRGRNFRITRTLAPGRYYLRIAATALPGAAYELRTATVNPRTWTGGAAGEDAGNHCGHARAVAAGDAVDGRFDRPGDVDVFAVHLAAPGVLEIGAESALTYELKAADCATSIGLADGSLGSTLTPLPAGTYFVYASQPQRAAGGYHLRFELH